MFVPISFVTGILLLLEGVFCSNVQSEEDSNGSEHSLANGNHLVQNNERTVKITLKKGTDLNFIQDEPNKSGYMEIKDLDNSILGFSGSADTKSKILSSIRLLNILVFGFKKGSEIHDYLCFDGEDVVVIVPESESDSNTQFKEIRARIEVSGDSNIIKNKKDLPRFRNTHLAEKTISKIPVERINGDKMVKLFEEVTVEIRLPNIKVKEISSTNSVSSSQTDQQNQNKPTSIGISDSLETTASNLVGIQDFKASSTSAEPEKFTTVENTEIDCMVECNEEKNSYRAFYRSKRGICIVFLFVVAAFCTGLLIFRLIKKTDVEII